MEDWEDFDSRIRDRVPTGFPGPAQPGTAQRLASAAAAPAVVPGTAQRLASAAAQPIPRRRHGRHAEYDAAKDKFEAEFGQDLSRPLKAGWTGARMLGEGGQGVAGLWVKLDDKETIVDRVVCKETYCSNFYFNGPDLWMPGQRYSWTRDAACMALCQNSLELDPIPSKEIERDKMLNTRKHIRAHLERSLGGHISIGSASLVQLLEMIDAHKGDWPEDTYKHMRRLARIYSEESPEQLSLKPVVVSKARGVLERAFDFTGFSRSLLAVASGVQGASSAMSSTLPRENIIEFRATTVDVLADPGSYRVYLEFCPGGDLGDALLDVSKKARGMKSWVTWTPQGLPVVHQGTQTAPIPEPYIWCLLLDLANACQAMDSPPGLGRNSSQHRVVHQDIKPANIFLSQPDSERFPKYPVAKIADFGSARLTSPDDQTLMKGHWDRDPVTLPFLPPEWNFRERPRSFNLWQCAMSVLCLMRLENYHPTYSPEHYMAPEQDPEMFATAYSADLVDLIARCLQRNPARRPTPKEVIDIVTAKINQPPPSAPIHGMFDPFYANRSHLSAKYWLPVKTPVDKYRVGMKYVHQASEHQLGKRKADEQSESQGAEGAQDPSSAAKRARLENVQTARRVERPRVEYHPGTSEVFGDQRRRYPALAVQRYEKGRSWPLKARQWVVDKLREAAEEG